jgi:hypothetical protein
MLIALPARWLSPTVGLPCCHQRRATFLSGVHSLRCTKQCAIQSNDDIQSASFNSGFQRAGQQLAHFDVVGSRDAVLVQARTGSSQRTSMQLLMLTRQAALAIVLWCLLRIAACVPSSPLDRGRQASLKRSLLAQHMHVAAAADHGSESMPPSAAPSGTRLEKLSAPGRHEGFWAERWPLVSGVAGASAYTSHLLLETVNVLKDNAQHELRCCVPRVAPIVIVARRADRCLLQDHCEHGRQLVLCVCAGAAFVLGCLGLCTWRWMRSSPEKAKTRYTLLLPHPKRASSQAAAPATF